MSDRKMETTGAALLGASTAAGIYSLGPKNTKTNRIQERRKKQNKKISESKVKVNQAKLAFAKEDLKRLQNIKNSDLDKTNIKIKNELIKKQKDIIKNGTSNPLKEIAKKVGLRTIPGASAFITAFSSSPAGKGSSFGKGEKIVRKK